MKFLSNGVAMNKMWLQCVQLPPYDSLMCTTHHPHHNKPKNLELLHNGWIKLQKRHHHEKYWNYTCDKNVTTFISQKKKHKTIIICIINLCEILKWVNIRHVDLLKVSKYNKKCTHTQNLKMWLLKQLLYHSPALYFLFLIVYYRFIIISFILFLSQTHIWCLAII